MALDVIQRDPVSGIGAKVDASGNTICTLTPVATEAGYAHIAGNDHTPMKIIGTGYIPASLESLQFYDTIDGTAIDILKWEQSALTMTITQANGFININAANSLAINTYAINRTIKNFFVTSCMPLHIHMSINSSLMNLPINTALEVGWGAVATNATPTDGVFLRARAGTLYGVINNGGTEQETAVAVLPNANQTYECVLDIYADRYKVFIDDVPQLSVTMPTSFSAVVGNARLPVFQRVYNTGTAPSNSPTLKLGQISVQQRNSNWDMPFSQKLVSFGRGIYQSSLTPFAQTANHVNSTSPTSATLSNTTAGYTTLGGRFQFAAPAGAATDFALFAFQVPAGYQAIIRGVEITAMNTGAIVATTATVLDWSIAVNSSAVSLATADGAGTWAPRRVPIGMSGFGIGAIIGYTPEHIDCDLEMACDSLRYIHIIVQVPVGTATAGQIIRGTVLVHGYLF